MQHVQGTAHAERAAIGNMRVDHGSAHIRVAQQLLNGANVGAAFQQVRSEAVPKDVG